MTGADFLRRLLTRRCTDTSTVPARGISRRGFLVGSAALPAARLPQLGPPLLYREGTAIVVAFRGLRWVLDPARFGRAASVRGRQDERSIMVRLHGASLPGTDVNVSVTGYVFERGGRWRVRLRMPGLGLSGTVPLDQWMSGQVGLSGTFNSPIRLGPNCRVTTARARVVADSAFGIELTHATGELSFAGAGRCQTGRITLSPGPPSADSLRSAGGLERRHATCFALFDPRWERPPQLICGTRLSSGKFCCTRPASLSGEFAETSRGAKAAFLLFEGEGQLNVGQQRRGPAPASIQLDRSATLLARVGGRRRLLVAGTIREDSYVDTGFGLAKIRPDPSRPVFADFASGEKASFAAPARLSALTLALADGSQASIELPGPAVRLDVWSEANGAATDEHEGDDRAGGETELAGPHEMELDDPDRPLNWMQAGPQPFIMVQLDASRIRITRGTDLFDVTFELTGYSLSVNAFGEARLRRRRPPNLTAPWPRAQLIAHFPPQHIGETITPIQGLDCAPPDLTPPPVESRQYGPSRIVFDLGPDTEGRIHWHDRPLTIESLTAWADLPMLVQPRARQELGVDLTKQLQAAGVEQDTTLEQAFSRIAAQLQPPTKDHTALELTGRLVFSPSEVGRWLTPRLEPGTSTLIWNARLDETGRATVRAIWSQWLEPGRFGHCFMRAGEPHQSMNSGTCGPPASPPVDLLPWDDKMLALKPRDHWNIVGQTSLYGLPALRRITPAGQAPAPTDSQFRKIPRATVVRPEAPYEYLKRIDECQYNRQEESGVALAAPFNDADITLTSLGGIFVADWQGDPPLLLPIDGTWACSALDRLRGRGSPRPDRLRGFQLERLMIETWLGRDVRVETFEKGYLLPFGIRASYVRIVERRFIRNPDGDYPVAYAVRRTFLLIQRPLKEFPAVNHPYGGRATPASSILMTTRVTPDLLAPEGGTVVENRRAGRILEENLCSGALVFWPRVAPYDASTATPPPTALPPGDVEFKFTCDEKTSPTTGHMLFVSNQALQSEADLKAIADDYRSTDRQRRTFAHGGAKRRYAPTDREGETEFDTDNWVLTVSGRKLPTEGGEIESFLMDGRMEGADQPPFYPELENAQIVVQSLDRLLGRTQGLITVRYDDTYRVTGFSEANKGEIFLQVVAPPVRIDFAGQGEAVGGIAQPNSFLAALSRTTGLVGGSNSGGTPPTRLYADHRIAGFERSFFGAPPASVAANAMALARLEGPARASAVSVAAAPRAGAFTYEQAREGKFSPAEFFGQGSGAKLLGVINLAEVIKVVAGNLSEAPRLVETLRFGAMGDAEGEALDRVRQAAEALWPSVKTAIEAVDRAILKVQLPPPPPSPPDEPDRVRRLRLEQERRLTDRQRAVDITKVYFADLYPDLNRAYRTARRALAGSEEGPITDGEGSYLRAIADANSLGEVARAGTELMTALRPLPSAIARIAKDPIPPLIQGKLDQIAGAWKNAESLFLREYGDLWRILRRLVNAQLHDFCRQADLAGLASLLFGIESHVTCDDLLANPRGAAVETADALFATHFAEPLLRLLTAVQDFQTAATAQIAFARRRLEVEIHKIIDKAVASIRDAIEDTSPILQQSESLARDLVRDAKAAIDAAFQLGGELADILERTEAAIDRFEGLAQSHVRTWLDQIIVKAAEEEDEIRERFRRETVEPVTQMLQVTLRAEVERVRALVRLQSNFNPKEIADYLVQLADGLLDSLITSSAFANIAQIGTTLDQWCRGANGQVATVLAAANALGNKMAGAQDAIEDALKAIVDRCNAAPFPTPIAAVERARRRLLELVQSVARVVEEIGRKRDELAGLVAGAGVNCDDPKKFLAPAGRLANLRRDAAGRIREILLQTSVLLEEMRKAGMSPAEIRQVSDKIVFEAKRLLSGLTSIGAVAQAQDGWRDAKTAIDDLIQEFGARAVPERAGLEALERATRNLGGAPPGVDVDRFRALIASASDYVGALETAKTEIQQRANDLWRRITNTADPAALREVADSVIDYARSQDKELIALVLKSAAMPLAAADALFAGVSTLLKEMGTRFWTLESNALTALDGLLVWLNDPVVQLLINPDVGEKLRNARKKLSGEVDELLKLKDGIPDTVTAARGVRNFWRTHKPPALVDIVTEALDVFRNLLNGNLGAVFNTDLRPALQMLEAHARDILRQFVPTGLSMSYELSSALKDFPPLFRMTDGVRKTNLVLKARVEADFLSGTRTVEVTGTLEPFTLQLVGSLDVATILFETATFRSVNGASPKFDVKVKDVKLGKLLEFLQPLQAWLSPKGSGFYLKPILKDGPGIEAGYIYDAGVIQVGTIQFINVSFGVFARLYFSAKDAQFGASVGRMEKPVLLAQPPYGGGGYIVLIANAERITEAEVSISMGAVTAIRFGPLDAQGRVVAGFTLRQFGQGRELIAFVEAVGEGNIACFSICVSLRVELRRVDQPGNSRMYGWARYSFSFKVGRFLEYKYSVVAQYNIAGGNKQATGQSQALVRADEQRLGLLTGPAVRVQCNPAPVDGCRERPKYSARYVNRVPSKAADWRSYRRHLSTNLLGEPRA